MRAIRDILTAAVRALWGPKESRPMTLAESLGMTAEQFAAGERLGAEHARRARHANT